MNKPNLLFVTSAHPGGSGFIGAGEGVCEASLRKWVSEGFDVHVLCFASHRQYANPAVVDLCASYKTFNQSAADSLLGIIRGLRWGSLLAPWFFTRSSEKNIIIIKKTLTVLGNCRIWFDFASCLGFVPYFSGTEIDYFVHDVVSQNISRRAFLGVFSSKVSKTEKRLISYVTRCHVLSEKDMLLLRSLEFIGEIVISEPKDQRPGTVINGRPISTILPYFEGGCNLVFFGNMQRPENHWSMMHFIIFQFYLIRRVFPQAKLWILGLQPRLSLRLLAKVVNGVVVTGAIDDPVPALRAATLCVAPLRLGAGVKIKVLQMLDAGATVIATPVASEGIAMNERLVVVKESEFVNMVCLYLANLPVTGHEQKQVGGV
jgi:hypothetical protein